MSCRRNSLHVCHETTQRSVNHLPTLVAACFVICETLEVLRKKNLTLKHELHTGKTDAMCDFVRQAARSVLCLRSDAVDHFNRNKPAAHEWSICSLLHLVQPLTSDLLASSKRDRHTFEQLMSDPWLALGPSTNFYQLRSQPFTRLVIIDRSLIDVMRVPVPRC